MVRRGSTVRVRQRALQKARKSGLLRPGLLEACPACGGYGALYGAFHLIELIPPVHQRVYRMRLEHLGVVVGEEIDDFSRVHRAALTGQQFQSPEVEPYYIL